MRIPTTLLFLFFALGCESQYRSPYLNPPPTDLRDKLFEARLRGLEWATTAPLKLYVDAAGNDGNPCTQSAPCRQIQAALDRVPKRIEHAVTINVGSGTFTGAQISGFHVGYGTNSAAGAYLHLRGTMGTPTLTSGNTSGTLTAVVDGGNTSSGTVSDSTSSWSPGELRGMHIEFLDGSAAGDVYVISTNTATQITLVGTMPVDPTVGSRYRVVTPASIINEAYPDPVGLTGALDLDFGVSTNITAAGLVVTGNTSARTPYRFPFSAARLALNVGGSARALYVNESEFLFYDSLSKPTSLSITGTLVQSSPEVRLEDVALMHATTGSANSGIYLGATPTTATSTVFGHLRRVLVENFATGVMTGKAVALSAYEMDLKNNTQGIVSRGVVLGIEANRIRIDCVNQSGSIGVQLTDGLVVGSGPASITLRSTSINNCPTAVSLTGFQLALLDAVYGTGNTVGISASKGARVQANSSNTVTGTTELSIDGVTSTWAAMRAASPKLLKDANYGTILYE